MIYMDNTTYTSTGDSYNVTQNTFDTYELAHEQKAHGGDKVNELYVRTKTAKVAYLLMSMLGAMYSLYLYNQHSIGGFMQWIAISAAFLVGVVMIVRYEEIARSLYGMYGSCANKRDIIYY